MQTIVPNAQAPARWSVPPPRMGFNPSMGQGFQNHRPNFPAHQFQPRAPTPSQNSLPIQMVNELDAKRPVKKTSARKTVDYNAAILHYLEARTWQRDKRDRRAVQPDSIYYADIMPPQSMLHNPTNAVTTKFVRTSTNKMRCPIFVCVWTPEGRRLITGASSGEFTLWNGLTFNFETILQAHDSPVRSMVWSHNDLWMVTGDHAGYVKYWQSNMNNVKMFQAHKEAIRGLSFCPTDTKIVTCSDDGTVRVMDFLRCHEEKVLRGHGADVKSVDWHPQKGLIVSGSKDSQQPIKLWDPRSGQSLATIHVHKSTVMCTKWNQNGNWLLTGSRDHLLKIFDIRNLSQEIQTFRGHKKEVCSVAWHPQHETLFASGGSDGSIMFWDVGTDKEVGCMEQAHDSIVWTLSWHPLGHILCSGSNDHTSKFWTRNRPGDKMRDKYNLNTLPKGVEDSNEYDEPTSTNNSAPLVIPGMGLEQSLLEKLKPEPEQQEAFIPGLDFNIDDSLPAKKVPFAKPIPKSFQQQWMENKRPVSLLPAPPPKPDGSPDEANVVENQVPTQSNPPMGQLPMPDMNSAPPQHRTALIADRPPGFLNPNTQWNTQSNRQDVNRSFQPGPNDGHKQRPPHQQNFNFSEANNGNQQFDRLQNMSGDNDDRSQNRNPSVGSFGDRDSGKNSNFNNGSRHKNHNQDDRAYAGSNNSFGDSDLRTMNNSSNMVDHDERQSFQRRQQYSNADFDSSNQGNDVDERRWNSPRGNFNNDQMPHNDFNRKRNWGNGPGSKNNANFSNDRQFNSRGRGGRGSFGRGRPRGGWGRR